MQEKWNASSSGVGEALLAWLSLIQGPRGPGGGLMGPPHPPTSLPRSPWGLPGCPHRAGTWWRVPREPGEAEVTFETWSWKSRRPALLLGRRGSPSRGQEEGWRKTNNRELTAEKGAHGSESGSWVTRSKPPQTQTGTWGLRAERGS